MQVPAPFEYERASSVEHALTLLRELGPEARILAGGHSLLPMMKLRLAAPEYLIDIDDLAGELGYVREQGDEIRIGAMTRHRELLESSLLAERAAIFTDAERVIADPVVRNRGTIGGALCQADPSEDLSAVCAAVDARMVIRGPDGERVLDMHEFNRGPYRTAVEFDELLMEIRIP
ncbi:MAG: aerobic carbon-monoxide dehydrogenase medium subunit, partial [Solirubrobacteraceae bacterium]|nr:aerobic carbon-monoxide dehydrogenase medium subunit [Solirubrobacteraceae bacterium]